MAAPLTLAATALGLGLGTGTAGAAELTRTDTFTFTNPAGNSVTCTVESFQELSQDGRITASTTLSGPADCTASRLGLFLQYSGSGDSGTARVDGEGRFLSTTIDAAATSVVSTHFVTLAACDCGAGYDLSQSK